MCSVSPIPVHAVNDSSGSLSLVGIEPAGAEYNVLRQLHSPAQRKVSLFCSEGVAWNAVCMGHCVHGALCAWGTVCVGHCVRGALWCVVVSLTPQSSVWDWKFRDTGGVHV